MPKRADQGQGEKLNWLIHHEVMPAVAKQFPDLDVLPGVSPNFDFFGRGADLFKEMSKARSGDLDHNTGIVIQKLIHRLPRLPKGQERYTEEQRNLAKADPSVFRGPLYGYKAYLDQEGFAPERFSFSSYFVMVFKQMARNLIATSYKGLKSRIPHVSTGGAGEYEETGPGGVVSPGILADPSSPEPSSVAERNENRRVLDEMIPSQLALVKNERDNKILQVFYKMYILGGAYLWEVGERLDQLGQQDSDYWPEEGGVDEEGNPVPWATSTLGRYKDTIVKIMQRYYREQRRKKHPEALSPEEKKAIFQSRRRA